MKEKQIKSWDSKFYDEHSVFQYETAVKLLEDLKLNGNELILDVGCGSGKISFELSRRVSPRGKVIGLDLSEEMIAYAKEKYKSPNLSFVIGDVSDMSFYRKFDVIVSFWTLSWVQNQKKALENIINGLKEGGRMFLMYPMRHDAYDVINNVVRKSHWQKFFVDFQPRPFVSEDQYRLILNKLGIVSEFCQTKLLKHKFKNYDEMAQSIRTWSSHLDKIPSEGDKLLFIDEIIREYLRANKTDSFQMNFSVLLINANKPRLIHGQSEIAKEEQPQQETRIISRM